MLLQPWDDVGEVEYSSIGGAYWMFEGLKAKCAVIEGEPFK